jgi:hypothetical protein
MPFSKLAYGVAFYGRVVDQYANPVAGAIVVVDAGGKFKLTTDDKGIFGIEGNLGQVLTINSVEKQRYGIPPRGLGVLMFTYAPHDPARHHPDPAHPVVVRVWKQNGNADPLLRFNIDSEVPVGDRPYSFDLLHNRVHAGATNDGDLQVTAARIGGESSPGRCELSLRAVGGGLVDLNDGTAYGWIAPEEGYRPELTLGPQLLARAHAWIFFRSRDGHVHGMFLIQVRPAGHGLGVRIQGFLNPRGSRNLERDNTRRNVVASYEDVKDFKPRRTPTSFLPSPYPWEVNIKVQAPGVFKVPPAEEPKRPPMPKIPTADLYAKTVDQDGKPLPGIEVQIAQQSLPPKQEWEPLKATSNQQGMVIFPGVRHGILQLKIQNDDYLPDPSMDDYLQSGLQFGASDRPEERGWGVAPAKPYLWRLWKRRGPPQPLVSGLLAVNCPSDGTPVPVDLLADHPLAKIPAGTTADLKLSISRSPEDKFMVRSPWDFWVEAPSGGIVETGESFMYLAPEAGYRSKIEAGGQQKWSVGERLFLKTRDGNMYGSVLLTVSAIGVTGGPATMQYSPPGQVQIRYVLNPTGSRSLEPDPKRTYKSYNEYLKAEKQK